MSAPPPHPLAQLTRAELAYLRKAIERRQLPTPITAIALQSAGKDKLYARLGPLATASREPALALIELALCAGDAAAVTGPAAATLVWTGPAVHLSSARPTTPMVLELLGAARQRVLVAGYEFDHGAVIFEPLHRAMRDHGVAVSVFLDIRPAPGARTAMDAYLALQAHAFVKRNWPFGTPLPALYYFPAGVAHGSRTSLHAKCVVVDGKHVLVGSANFTRRGHTRNVEVGVRLEDAALAAALTGQFERLVEQGDLLPLPVATAVRGRPPDAAEDETETENENDSGAAGGDARAPTAMAAAGFEQLADELYVSAEARPLFVRVLAAGLLPPQVGADIEAADGGVIGSAELSWQEPRVAVLLAEQESGRKQLEAADWTCVSLSLAAQDLDMLCELIAREQQGAG